MGGESYTSVFLDMFKSMVAKSYLLCKMTKLHGLSHTFLVFEYSTSVVLEGEVNIFHFQHLCLSKILHTVHSGQTQPLHNSFLHLKNNLFCIILYIYISLKN